VVPEDNSTTAVLASVSESATFIASQSSGIASNYGEYGWSGSLAELDPTEMYKLNMDAPATLTITGVPVDVASTPISLIAGWNWISYLPQNPGDLNAALATVSESATFIASQSSGIASNYGEYGWSGSLASLFPGNGYLLNMDAPGVLVYPEFEGLTRLAENKQEVVLNKTISDWDFNYADYEFIGTITASLENHQDSDGDLVGVFVDGKCRGISERMYFPFDDSYYYIIQVYSNVSDGENMIFKYYDKSTDEVVEYAEVVEFSDNMVVGDGFNTFSLSRLAAIEEFDLQKAYPNPFNPTTSLILDMPEAGHISVQVYNIKGQVVATLANGYMNADTHTLRWDASNLSSGMYFVKAEAAGKVTTQKLILMK
jgi:hypothetical protein